VSQHDFNIANQGFPATRADINNAFQAIASNSSGPTAPSTTYANMWWYDTTNNKMYLRNEADSAWIEVATIDQTNNEWQITTGVVQAKDSDGLALKTDDGTTRLFIKDSDGAVGIGTSSPVSGTKLTLNDSAFGGMQFQSGGSDCGYIGVGSSTLYIGAGSVLAFHTGNSQATDGTERMRIDGSSGDVYVGKTSGGLGNQGAELNASGQIKGTAANQVVQYLNRTSSDGSILEFRKNNSTVGGIGNASSNSIYIAGNTGAVANLGFGGTTVIYPTVDNVGDIGASNFRFDDIFATNGTIQTSDQNEKQQIASLTDAEITAAKAISKLFKTFKWNDSVTEKGDAARTHSGVIAQEVEQAMTDAGLSAGDYAFFISTTWWETQTDVPAVEAVDEVLDEDGNVITEAVEAQEAYTRTDTYETAEEAPEGATERNRKGIRYPQLLSFIGAATEQRLASIESRLDALEA
jgi:hypothetical protein